MMKRKKILSFFLATAVIFSLLVLPARASDKIITSADYTKQQLDCSSYDVTKYATPFWEGNIVYNECIYPITKPDGSIPAFSLMYKASEIVSVKNYELNITYKEGRDYRLTEDGKLEILPNGYIGVNDYYYVHPTSNPAAYPVDVYYPRKDGKGYEYWNEGPEFSRDTIAVTYIHNDTWQYSRPESLENQLPKTMSKLVNKQPLNVVIMGDSITWGAKSSSCLHISPQADAYAEMTIKAFGEKFGCRDITYHNSNVGGSCADDFTESQLYDYVVKYSPEFVIICFGMNDASSGRSADTYMRAMEKQVSYIRSRLPECEILLLTSPYGNPYTFSSSLYEAHAKKLHEIAGRWQGVAVADAQTIEKDLLQKKDFLDLMGDNMVHPNDYGMRLLCQTIISGFSVSDIAAYRTTVLDDFSKKALSSTDDPWKLEVIQRLIDRTKETLAGLSNEWEITKAIDQANRDISDMSKWCQTGKHSFETVTTPPTCTEAGTSHSVCRLCGYEEDGATVPALGGQHIISEGIQVKAPTEQSAGLMIATCIRCGKQIKTEIPVLPEQTTGGMAYVSYGYNYMPNGEINPYKGGDGTVELDVCPLDVSKPDDVPYIGVRLASDYSIAASYNFREQRFEIVKNNLPYTAESEVFATKSYTWTPNSGDNVCNWKKFAVKVQGNTVSIYLNGELMLSDTNSLYNSNSCVALVYSTGEYYLDNIRVGGAGYDPATGKGTVLGNWELDNPESFRAFDKSWDFGTFTPIVQTDATSKTRSTACYRHEHAFEKIGQKPVVCGEESYEEFRCTVCGVLEKQNQITANNDTHFLTSRVLSVEPTATTDGQFVYTCARCGVTFTQEIPAGTSPEEISFSGDVNRDGEVNSADQVLLNRKFAKWNVTIDEDAADINRDGHVDSVDAAMLSRLLAKWDIDVRY